MMSLAVAASASSSDVLMLMWMMLMFTKVNLDTTMHGQAQDEEVHLDVTVRKEGYCRIHGC